MTRHAERDGANRFTRRRPTGVEVPRVEWDEFLTEHFHWQQGEHVSMIGPTGAGKTTLALNILHKRAFVCVLATKPRDDTLDRLIREEGYEKLESWPSKGPRIGKRKSLRLILWPPVKSARDKHLQVDEFDEAMDSMYRMGGWTLLADELYILKKLGLDDQLTEWWSQGRSSKLSLVGGTQRPAHVNLMIYDQATHLFFWRDNDERNLKRMSGMNGADSRVIRETVETLARHDTFYVNTRTGAMLVTRPPGPNDRKK